jgi:hypothetical protein
MLVLSLPVSWCTTPKVISGFSRALKYLLDFYVVSICYRQDGDSIKNRDGESVQIDSEGQGSLDLNAYVLGFYWTSEFKILGGN